VQPIVASVDLLVARAGAAPTAPLETIADGAVLRDGRGDPAAGDKLKVRFNVNCECFVYVIGIDATGYVARIFPDSSFPIGNPVAAGREVVVPGEGEWWGLDDQRGVEQIHVIASYVARTDIEQTLDALADQPRAPAANYRAVAHAVEMPSTRGLVKVKDVPAASVTTSSGATGQFTPTSFLGRGDDIGVVVTRWFRHE
jgi:hypothetical protein